jgi:perosamine synthetase
MNPFIKKIPRGIIYHKVRESIQYLFASFFLPLGEEEKIREFESAFAKYCERDYCVAFPFARTAIYFVLKHLNLPLGSEVILPPITIKGIVDVVVGLGLVPVYVDLDVETINFQLDSLKKKINPKVKVAIITPLFGLVPDMAEMVKMLKDHGIFVLEDFSQCLNGRFGGKRVGTFGDVGIYSSSSIKTLDTLGGGMAVTNDLPLYESLRRSQDSLFSPSRKFLIQKAWINLVRNVATSKMVFHILTFPLLQIIRKINPDLSLKQTGHRNKNRLSVLPKLWFRKYTSIQAEIGLSHIHEICADDEKRIDNANFVKTRCGTEQFPITTERSGNVYWQLIVLVPDAVKAQVFLAARGIDSATSSLELVSALEEYPNKTALPAAEKIYSNGIFIPCFPNLSKNDMERIVAATRALFQKFNQ